MTPIKACDGCPGGIEIRLALISDVHSNLPALEVVLEAISMEGVDLIVHAGDVVGYNPYPNEVIQVMKRAGVRTIRGNHDRAALTGDTSWFNDYAARAIEWTRRSLEETSIAYLRGLEPYLEIEAGSHTLKVYHGSPRDEDEYVFADQASPVLLRLAGCEILVLGHTHVPYVHITPAGLILNPGSVGQPRDGDARASWALLESEAPSGEIRRVRYDVAQVYERVLSQGLPQFLGERLLLGR